MEQWPGLHSSLRHSPLGRPQQDMEQGGGHEGGEGLPQDVTHRDRHGHYQRLSVNTKYKTL